MTQIHFKEKSGIQDKAIQMLQSDKVHFEAMFAFHRDKNGKIEPMIIVADDVPDQEAVIQMLYALFDVKFNFRKIQEGGEYE